MPLLRRLVGGEELLRRLGNRLDAGRPRERREVEPAVGESFDVFQIREVRRLQLGQVVAAEHHRVGAVAVAELGQQAPDLRRAARVEDERVR